MARKPISPKHRRLYVSMRLKQIQQETKALQARKAEKPEPGPRSEERMSQDHRQFVFNRLRGQELRKELIALKAEAKTFKKTKPAP